MVSAFSIASMARSRALKPRERRRTLVRGPDRKSWDWPAPPSIAASRLRARGRSAGETVLRDDLPGKGDRRRLQIAFDGPVDEAQLQGFLDAEHPRAGDNVERGLEAADAGKALGATAARDDAEADFRKGEDGGLVGHPIMAGQRRLQPAAEGARVDRGDNGLVREIDEPGRARASWAVASGWPNSVMSAPEKKLDPSADDDRRLDGWIAGDFAEPLVEARPDRLADGVDGRIVRPQKGDLAATLQGYGLGKLGHELLILPIVRCRRSRRKCLQGPIALVELALVGEGQGHHGQPLEVMAHVEIVGHAHAAMDLHRLLAHQACGLVDLKLHHDGRARVDRIFRPADPASAACTWEAAISVAANMSTMRCCRAWKDPRVAPNCSRVLA